MVVRALPRHLHLDGPIAAMTAQCPAGEVLGARLDASIDRRVNQDLGHLLTLLPPVPAWTRDRPGARGLASPRRAGDRASSVPKGRATPPDPGASPGGDESRLRRCDGGC